VDLCLCALLNFPQSGIVGTSNEGEEFRWNRLQAKAHVRATLLDDCFDLPARHLRSHSITLNQHIDGIAIVIVGRSGVVIGAGNLDTSTGTALDILNDCTLAANDVGTGRGGDRHTNRLLLEKGGVSFPIA
jgi:hypothetical protein